MSDKLYAIKGSTLTALGDAIRNKVAGITELPIITVENQRIGYSSAYPYTLPDYVKKVKISGIIDFIPSRPEQEIFKPNASYGSQGLGVAPGNYTHYDDSKVRDSENYQVVWQGYPRGGDSVPTRLNFEVIVGGNRGAFVATKLNNIPECFYISYTAIGLDENGNEFKYTPLEMVDAINELNIPSIKPIILTSNCSYACAGPLSAEMIKHYNDKIETKDITSMDHMFYKTTLEEIPLVLNGNPSVSNLQLGYLFSDSKDLKVLPEMRNIKPGETHYIFASCSNLREIPENFGENWDWSYIDNLTSTYSGSRSNMFYYCCSLRKLPMKFLEHGNPNATYSYSIYYYLVNNAYNLDEIINLPFPHYNATWTSNAFANAFGGAGRLKEMTFALQEDGSPYVMKWKGQNIEMSSIGYHQYTSYVTGYNCGITLDKQVKDDATYQALKNDPDWWTTDANYSRYNHDSAVNTINSLPDCSATGTNTIKFKGASGAKTDGGAINTLTEAEIAVASAKGWTVTLV